MLYLGDYADDATVDFKWSSNNAAGASITRATNGTVSVYVGNSTTQLTTGVTDTEDFDSLTGIHHCRIDLSSSATYATGSECQVVLSAATIDGQTVNAVIAHFSIERAGGVLALFKARIPAALVGGRMDSNASAVDGVALNGGTGAIRGLGIIDKGTAQSATGTTLVLRSAAAFADDELIGATIVITGGSAGVGQSRAITDYVSTTDTATVETWTTTPTGTITYEIYGTAPGAAGGGLDAAGVRAAVGLASANLDTQLSGIQSDTNDIQTRLPAALVSGRMDSSVGAMAANVMTAAAAAADLTTELQSGLATAAALDAVDNFLDTEIAAIISTLGTPAGASVSADIAAVKAQTAAIETDTAEIGAAGAGLTVLATQASVNTIDDFLDTEVAAIKAKTDQLTFTVANRLDANTKNINDVAVIGAGTALDKWRA
jgi:hypothetical protein